MKKFALIGVGGYIAPRHIRAIKDTKNDLVAAIDPNDSVGVLDRFFPETKFFTEIERFDRYLEKARREGNDKKIDYISICSPNYLHDAHIRLALRTRSNAICEKPLTINPWNIDALKELEQECGTKVFTILQLRLLPSLQELKKQLSIEQNLDICLSYITKRGPWYFTSWKGNEEKSGGVAMNIGIHFFDLLFWLFGKPVDSQLHLHQKEKMAGIMYFEKAKVRWFLSVDGADLPDSCRVEEKTAYRSLTINGQEIEFSEGFTDLHTQAYKNILSGNGFGLDEARAAIEIVHQIRKTPVSTNLDFAHPILRRT